MLMMPPWMLFVKPLILKQNHDLELRLKEINGGDFEMSQVSSPPKKISSLEGSIELTPVQVSLQSKSEESAYEEQE